MFPVPLSDVWPLIMWGSLVGFIIALINHLWGFYVGVLSRWVDENWL